jgi:glycosyltransferase involved in cell wall biosynthesis
MLDFCLAPENIAPVVVIKRNWIRVSSGCEAQRRMRVAIIHYWLLGMRGGEKVLEALCRMLPEADLFTLFYDPEKVSPLIRSHRVTASFLNPLRRRHRSLLPLMPMALESFDLRGYDLVISSESGYCHTPMRYLWDLYPAYLHEWTRSRFKRALIAPFANYLRLWDFAAAARVDEFVANSENVRKRIWKTYRRDAAVIHPPVAVEPFRYERAGDYYLIVSELVPYKRIDLAVRTFSKNGRKLRIVGDGPEYSRLRRIASPNIEFCGRVADDGLRSLYAGCRAFLMPGEEDFGITTVESLASGKAVIALGRGGVLEIVPPEGAFFFDSPDEECFEAAILEFESAEAAIEPVKLQAAAQRFSEAAFDCKMRDILYKDNVQHD